jgi:hypothetical protein
MLYIFPKGHLVVGNGKNTSVCVDTYGYLRLHKERRLEFVDIYVSRLCKYKSQHEILAFVVNPCGVCPASNNKRQSGSAKKTCIHN